MHSTGAAADGVSHFGGGFKSDESHSTGVSLSNRYDMAALLQIRNYRVVDPCHPIDSAADLVITKRYNRQ